MPEEQQRQEKLGKVLVDKGIISEAQLKDALEEQRFTKRFLGEILVDRKAASEEQIAKILSTQLGLAYVDLNAITIEKIAINLIPEEIAVKYTAMPLFMIHDTLTVAMANPLDIHAIDELQSLSHLRVRPVFACLSAIRNAINRYYRNIRDVNQVPPSAELPVGPEDSREDSFASQALPPQKVNRPRPEGASDLTGGGPRPMESVGGDIPTGGEAIPPQPAEITTDQVASLKEAAGLSQVVDMVNNIISKAIELNASDVHLEPQRNNLNCRYRVDGVLHKVSEIPLNYQAAVISRIKIMSNMDIAEKRLPQDGRLRMTVTGKEVDLRISTFPTLYGENLVIRILDRSSGILQLKQLGFSDKPYKKFLDLIKRPHGIILVTGPTGSGKTTTLYAALSEINTVEKNIITLEDPIEYELHNVRQSQVNVKAGLTFAAGLRSIVRQDPDVIMVGEIRDRETADISIHAALTGHLVFSTLHTNDAPSAAARLIDMGVEPFLVSSSIIGIMAQRLIRILCPNCKQQYSVQPELMEQFGIAEQGKQYTFYKETGCAKCKQRGYTGRTGIYELLIPNDRIKELIAQKASATVLRDEAIKSGMKTLRDSGIEKVMKGTSSVAEVLRVTEEG